MTIKELCKALKTDERNVYRLIISDEKLVHYLFGESCLSFKEDISPSGNIYLKGDLSKTKNIRLRTTGAFSDAIVTASGAKAIKEAFDKSPDLPVNEKKGKTPSPPPKTSEKPNKGEIAPTESKNQQKSTESDITPKRRGRKASAGVKLVKGVLLPKDKLSNLPVGHIRNFLIADGYDVKIIALATDAAVAEILVKNYSGIKEGDKIILFKKE